MSNDNGDHENEVNGVTETRLLAVATRPHATVRSKLLRKMKWDAMMSNKRKISDVGDLMTSRCVAPLRDISVVTVLFS